METVKQFRPFSLLVPPISILVQVLLEKKQEQQTIKSKKQTQKNKAQCS